MCVQQAGLLPGTLGSHCQHDGRGPCHTDFLKEASSCLRQTEEDFVTFGIATSLHDAWKELEFVNELLGCAVNLMGLGCHGKPGSLPVGLMTFW